MTLKEQTEIFSANLNRLLEEKRLTQKEVADAIGVTPQSLNYWCMGKNLPRMDKIQLLAEYLGVRYTDLIQKDVMEETLQEVFDRRPDIRVLFSVTKDCTPQEVEIFTNMINAYKNSHNEE